MQTVQTLIRGLLQEPSDLGLHCLWNPLIWVYTVCTWFTGLLWLKQTGPFIRHTPS